jgi:hypothetical protein
MAQSTNLLTIALIAVTLVGLRLANANYVIFGMPILIFIFARTLVRLVYWGKLSSCILWVSPNPSFLGAPPMTQLHKGANEAATHATPKENRRAHATTWFLRLPGLAKFLTYVLAGEIALIVLLYIPPF